MQIFNLKIQAPVTDLMALRVMRKGGRYPEFICGIDAVDGNKLVIANAPEVYSSNFVGCVRNVLKALAFQPYRDFSDAEYFLLCDDSRFTSEHEEWVQKECASKGDEELVYYYNEKEHRAHLIEIGPLKSLLLNYGDTDKLLAEQLEYIVGKPMS